jgi:hypothetical protein
LFKIHSQKRKNNFFLLFLIFLNKRYINIIYLYLIDKIIFLIIIFNGGIIMFPGYWSEGIRGENCSDCKRFRRAATNKAKGTCVGRDVVAKGGCDNFIRK